MTVSSTTNRVAYTGNGTANPLAVAFPFLATTDLVVIETTIATGAWVTKAITTDYTVTGTPDINGFYSSGGAVVPNAVIAATKTWTIYRDPAITQLTLHVDNDPLPAASIDNPLDKLTMIAQRARDMANRSFRAPDGDPSTVNLVLSAAAARANKLAGFDSSGNAATSSLTIAQLEAGYQPSGWINSAIYTVAQVGSGIPGAGRSDAGVDVSNKGRSGHALINLSNHAAAEEGAYTITQEYSDGSQNEIWAHFGRAFNNNNSIVNSIGLEGLHVVGIGADALTWASYSDNAWMIGYGDVSVAGWNDTTKKPPAGWGRIWIPANITGVVTAKAGSLQPYLINANYGLHCYGFASVGQLNSGNTSFGKSVEMGYSAGAVSAFVQGYDEEAAAFINLTLTGLDVTIGGGHVHPDTDNTRNCGTATKRWAIVYAGTGAINTSDATLKTVRADGLSAAEIGWARKIAALAKGFQWNDAIAKKGEAARIHFGVLAQDVIAAGVEMGLDPMRYSFICCDPQTREVKKTVVDGQRQKTVDVETEVDVVKIIDGKAVLTTEKRVHHEPMFSDHVVHDADGAVVMHEVNDGRPSVDADGKVINQPKKLIPRVHREPVMEDVLREVVVDEPTGETLHGIRYTDLEWFLRAAGV